MSRSQPLFFPGKRVYNGGVRETHFKTLRLWAVPLLVVPAFYLALALSHHPGFHRQKNSTSYSDRLAQTFLRGRIDLNIELEPAFAAHPYDFVAHWRYIMQKQLFDLSVYKGKVYSFFGATPVVLLYLPFRYLTGAGLPDPVAVVLFGYGAYLWSTALFLRIKKEYFDSVPEWMTIVFLTLLGTGNSVPYLIACSRVYEVCGASASFFVMGAIYLLCVGRLGWGSLFLGLAVGCRSHTALLAFALFPPIARRLLDGSDRERVKSLGSLLLPFAACLLTLGWYNQARFGSPWEFGIHYQLAPINEHLKLKLFGVENFTHNLYQYFFHLPKLDDAYPFLHLTLPPPPPSPDVSYQSDPIVGLLVGTPFLLLLPLHFILGPKNAGPDAFYEKKLLGGSAALMLLLLGALRSVMMRYLADVSALLLLLSGIAWFHWWLTDEGREKRLFLAWLGSLLALISVLAGVAEGLHHMDWPY